MSRKVFPQHLQIKRLREAEGWGQDWVAQAADISKRTYQRIEAGEGCSIETLKSIAAVFEVSFKTLLPAPEATPDNPNTYQPSWSRLLRHMIWLLIYRPLLMTCVTLSLFASALGVAYVAHQAEITHFTMFVPMTAEERSALDLKLAELNAQAPQTSKPILRDPAATEVLTEAEQYQRGFELIAGVFALVWLVAWCTYAFRLPYNRDYEMLISRPLESRCETAWQAFMRQIGKTSPSS